jgi:hypothetical protein
MEMVTRPLSSTSDGFGWWCTNQRCPKRHMYRSIRTGSFFEKSRCRICSVYVLQDVAESLVTTVVPTITPFFRLGSRCDDTPFIYLNRYFAFTTSWLPSCMGVLSNLVVQTSQRYWYIWITVFSLWFGTCNSISRWYTFVQPFP